MITFSEVCAAAGLMLLIVAAYHVDSSKCYGYLIAAIVLGVIGYFSKNKIRWQ